MRRIHRPAMGPVQPVATGSSGQASSKGCPSAKSPAVSQSGPEPRRRYRPGCRVHAERRERMCMGNVEGPASDIEQRFPGCDVRRLLDLKLETAHSNVCDLFLDSRARVPTSSGPIQLIGVQWSSPLAAPPAQLHLVGRRRATVGARSIPSPFNNTLSPNSKVFSKCSGANQRPDSATAGYCAASASCVIGANDEGPFA